MLGRDRPRSLTSPADVGGVPFLSPPSLALGADAGRRSPPGSWTWIGRATPSPKPSSPRARARSRTARSPGSADFEIYTKGEDRGLIVFRGGKNDGRKILNVGEKMWLIVPGASRALPITPNQRLLGGASVGDVARMRVRRGLHAAPARPGTETVGGKPCRVAGPDGEVGRRRPIRKVVLWFDEAAHLPCRLLFSLPSGKQAKDVTFAKFREVGRTDVRRRDGGAGPPRERARDRHAPRVPRLPIREDRRQILHAGRGAGLLGDPGGQRAGANRALAKRDAPSGFEPRQATGSPVDARRVRPALTPAPTNSRPISGLISRMRSQRDQGLRADERTDSRCGRRSAARGSGERSSPFGRAASRRARRRVEQGGLTVAPGRPPSGADPRASAERRYGGAFGRTTCRAAGAAAAARTGRARRRGASRAESGARGRPAAPRPRPEAPVRGIDEPVALGGHDELGHRDVCDRLDGAGLGARARVAAMRGRGGPCAGAPAGRRPLPELGPERGCRPEKRSSPGRGTAERARDSSSARIEPPIESPSAANGVGLSRARRGHRRRPASPALGGAERVRAAASPWPRKSRAATS